MSVEWFVVMLDVWKSGRIIYSGMGGKRTMKTSDLYINAFRLSSASEDRRLA